MIKTAATRQHSIYTVFADRQTGEWIGTPQPTGGMMSRMEFLELDNGDDTHRDTYEAETMGAGDTSSTRLILITWVD